MLSCKARGKNYGLSASKAPSTEGAFNFILPTQSLSLDVGARHSRPSPWGRWLREAKTDEVSKRPRRAGACSRRKTLPSFSQKICLRPSVFCPYFLDKDSAYE